MLGGTTGGWTAVSARRTAVRSDMAGSEGWPGARAISAGWSGRFSSAKTIASVRYRHRSRSP